MREILVYFLIYVAGSLYLWLLGVAVFGGSENRRSPFHAPWLGYAVLIACLQILHFFSAINPAISWTFLGISSLGAAGLLAFRLRKGLWKREDTRRLSLPVQLALLLGVAGPFFLPAFNTTTQAIVHYDVGYYYLQTIRWTTASPLVPGLGNLYLNLAFNQSPFLVASLFDSLGPHLWGYSLLGGVLPWLGLSLWGFALLQGLCALLELRGRLEPIEKAYLISLPAWIYTLLAPNISSNSPDIPSACLQIHLFLCFASFLAARDHRTSDEFGIVLVLAALSLAVKLNSAFFVAAICVLSLAVLMLRGGARVVLSKEVIFAALMAGAIFLPWVLRGIITSGYPFFPSSALGTPVAWKIPAAAVTHFYDITVYWGRQPFYDLEKVKSGFAWVPEWFQRNWQMKDQFERPFVLFAAWALLLAILAWRRTDLRESLVRLLLLTVPVVVSLVMWFLTAPDPRYLGTFTWLLPLAVPLSLIADVSLLSSAVIGLSLCINYAALANLRYNTEWAWKRRAPGFPEIRRVETNQEETPSGILIHLPKKGDQPFDAPLPSTREMRPFLKLLDETKGISGGFRDARIDDWGREAPGGLPCVPASNWGRTSPIETLRFPAPPYKPAP